MGNVKLVCCFALGGVAFNPPNQRALDPLADLLGVGFSTGLLRMRDARVTGIGHSCLMG